MRSTLVLAASVLAMALLGCNSTSESTSGRTASSSQTADLQQRANSTLQQMQSADPRLQDVINNSYAYAVLPDVGRGALVIGGAGGQGVAYRNGQPIGTVKLNQLSVGPQAGGGTYSQLVVFQNQQAFQKLESGSLQWGAEANATLLKAGANVADRFENGVAVYILPQGGLDVGASLNGQKMTFQRYGSTNQ